MDFIKVLNGKVVCAQPPEILMQDQLGIKTKASSLLPLQATEEQSEKY